MSPRRRAALALLCLGVTLAVVPRWWMGRDARAFLAAERSAQHELARRVAAAIEAHPERTFFGGSELRFDGQSAVAIYQMTLLGLGQVLLAHPDLREQYLPAMRLAAHRLADPRTLVYAGTVYPRHGVVAMGPREGHAYLGYVNLGLGMLRAVEPETPLAALHDRISDALAARLFASPTGLIETYPAETWPPDVAAVAGSVGLHARVTGRDREAQLAAWADRFAACSIHSSGYLVQRVRSGTCVPVDAPRGSGTAVAAYFLSFAVRGLARRLHEGLVATGMRSLLGFGALAEYAPGFEGSGDVNAGPILFGVSVGATGFGLGSARAHEAGETFTRLYRTLHLFGAPVDDSAGRWYATGGVLGNALLLAMLTARAE